MRRLGVLLAMVVAGSTFVGLSGTAVADANRPTSFCGTAKSVADDIENFDPSDLSDASVFDSLEKAYKRLAKQAPNSLKPAFKTITKYVNTLSSVGGDVPDPEDAQAFIEQSTKVGKALNKVFKYLSSKCNIDLG